MIEELTTIKTIKLTREDIEKLVLSYFSINNENEYEITWNDASAAEYLLIIQEFSPTKSFVPLKEIKRPELQNVTTRYGININLGRDE